ncbi:MAG TPA: ATP-binding protein [Ilumatobacteraceae bacterium]|nr:ATP-binding protein [Ilumatobacteraceae bacterium]
MSTHVADEPRTSSAAPLQTTVFETDAQLKKHLDRTPASIRQLILRFGIGAIAALTLVSVFTALASRRVGTERAIAEAQNATFYIAKGVIETNADDGLLTGDPDSIQRLDERVHAAVLSGPLVRIKLWTEDGTIIYSDRHELIGQQYVLDADKAEMFADKNNAAEAEVSDLSAPENVYERGFTKLLEVYQLTETTGHHPVVFEAYYTYSGVTAVGRDLWKQFAPIAIGALIALELIQVPIFITLTRRLSAAQHQRERLLRHAIQSSEAERRRIASDLHDGVVQELTGVSLSLAAASRSDSTDAPKMGEASSSIRSSIKSLRSLLVEIYPPNLHEEGLEFALGDLLGGVSNRGIAVKLDVDLGKTELSADTVGLLYRSAQEALRNVISHSGATKVRLTAKVSGNVARIVIDDDGRGFTPEQIEHTNSDGHFGLRALSGLVTESGGKMTVLSAPGAGTRVEVKLPALTGGQL